MEVWEPHAAAQHGIFDHDGRRWCNSEGKRDLGPRYTEAMHGAFRPDRAYSGVVDGAVGRMGPQGNYWGRKLPCMRS